jgi:hypothetical protein
MAKTITDSNPNMTVAVPKPAEKPDVPRVSVFLPALESQDDAGIKVDQYEHVTISNETGTETVYVHRGEHVEVPVPVFMALKVKYPNL